jgi:hypothetical protein
MRSTSSTVKKMCFLVPEVRRIFFGPSSPFVYLGTLILCAGQHPSTATRDPPLPCQTTLSFNTATCVHCLACGGGHSFMFHGTMALVSHCTCPGAKVHAPRMHACACLSLCLPRLIGDPPNLFLTTSTSYPRYP